MSEVYTECPECGFDNPDDDTIGIYNNGTGMASCLNCGWEEAPLITEENK